MLGDLTEESLNAPRVDQEDTIACYLATGVPLGTAVWSLFGDAITHGKRVEYWTFTVAPPVRYDFTGFFSPVENLPVVNRARAGQAVPVTAKILGVPVQTLGNWVRLSEKGQLKGAGDRPVSPEQMGAGALTRRECAASHGARHPGKPPTLESRAPYA